MDLIKHRDLFDPSTIKEPINIIGCGAIGSHLAELMVRLGLNDFHLFDFDIVEPKNLANQMFYHKHIGKPKVRAVAEQIQMVNPEAKITLYEEGYTDQELKGYVFLAVDNIELRLKICKDQEYNLNVLAMFDFRMRLTDAQHYAANWRDRKQMVNLMKTMNFTHDEASEATPVNACGSTLSIIPTIKVITSEGMVNFINFINNGRLHQTILIDAFNYSILAM